MTTTAAVRPLLARPRAAIVGGVCAAVATHLGWGVTRTRVLAVVLAVAGGAGVLLYLWIWAFAPLDTETDAVPTRRAPVAAIAAIAALVLCSMLALSVQDAALLLLSLLTSAASALAVSWDLVFDRVDPRRSAQYRLAWRVAAVAALALGGVAALVHRPPPVTAVLAVAMLVAAVAVVAAPRVVVLWTALLTERATLAREEQRAEIAAHLHDSVLQTLALIQNRAGASSEVARIARAQERELREWLYAGDRTRTDDLVAEIRELATTIELEHPVHFDVVATGEALATPTPLLAAVREAMLNAARHAGGDVSVYVESTGTAVDVFVRDRGSGVDIASLPDDRLGIRESIIGRMSRAGGTATVRAGAGGTGTEVHMHLEDA